MKALKLLISVAVAFLVALSMMLYVSGCKEKSTEPEDQVQPITDDLFPLIVGRKLVFSGTLRDAVTDLDIAATASAYEGRMTIVSNTAPTPVGGTSTFISDSSRVPTGVANPPTIWVARGFFVQRASPTGSGNISFLTDIGRFYRLFGITRTDSLRWVLLAKFDAGVNNEYVGFDSSWTTATGQVRLQIVGKITGPTTKTYGGVTFNNVYTVQASRNVYLGGTLVQDHLPTATVELQSNIGIVRFVFNSTGETPGFTREYKSRNF